MQNLLVLSRHCPMAFIRTGPALFRGWRSARKASRFNIANLDIVPSDKVGPGGSVLLVNPSEAAAALEAYRALWSYLSAIGKNQAGFPRILGMGGDYFGGGDFGGNFIENWKKMSLQDQARTTLLFSGTLELMFHLGGTVKDASVDFKGTLNDIMQKFRPIDPSDDAAKKQIAQILEVVKRLEEDKGVGGEAPCKGNKGNATLVKNGGGKKDEDSEDEDAGEGGIGDDI